MPKITKQFIDQIQAPETGQKFYRDDDIRGFAVRATKNSNAYILEKRVNGKTCRIALGNCDAMTLEAAKRRACELLGDLAKGIDPKTGKRINVLGDITLLEVLNKFLDTKPIREATKRNYHYAVKVHFHDWLDKPITSITKDMVEELDVLTVSHHKSNGILTLVTHGHLEVAETNIFSTLTRASVQLDSGRT